MVTSSPTVCVVFGTRPEAIKLCPLVRELRSHPSKFSVRTILTGQHRELVEPVLRHFEVHPDDDLRLMQPGQSLNHVAASVLNGLDSMFAGNPPQMVLVQGDTTTAMAAALAAFHRRIPVGHVEAGLRTGDLTQPFPEELNRVLTARLASLHFAPTTGSRENLIAEGVAVARIAVTGNTGIDALLFTRDLLVEGRRPGFQAIPIATNRKLILVTAHRRESFGEGFASICAALRRIAQRDDVQLVYPVHPNPNVRGVVYRELAGHSRIALIEPQEYVAFVDLMRRADIILTDSGGVQEEAPSLGKPVLVMRNKTERQEAVDAGTALLVGTDESYIVQSVEKLLNEVRQKQPVTSKSNPFGDGSACPRIAASISSFFRG